MEPFWRTIMNSAVGNISSDMKWTIRTYEAKDLSMFRRFILWMQGYALYKVNTTFYNSILTAVVGHGFLLTQDGRPGLCYPNVQPGDEMWVVHGAKVPFILRPRMARSEEIVVLDTLIL
jgi:hypothetical protein